jgi:hypothetical protein
MMRKGKDFIDGAALSDFGIGVTKGGYASLLAFPAMRTPPVNHWDDEHGIEPDLSNPVLETKSVTIPFFADENSDLDGFLDWIMSPGYHVFKSESLGREWKLRCEREQNRNGYRAGDTFEVAFVDDFPRKLFGVPEISVNEKLISPQSYMLDNISFEEFGVGVEKGKNSVLQRSELKKTLSRKIESKDGEIYHVDLIRFSAKDIELDCVLAAKSINVFWNHYLSFFQALIKPGEHLLYADCAPGFFPCFYKNADNFSFYRSSEITALKFRLVLTCEMYDVDERFDLLSTENGILVIAENNNVDYIEISYGKSE